MLWFYILIFAGLLCIGWLCNWIGKIISLLLVNPARSRSDRRGPQSPE